MPRIFSIFRIWLLTLLAAVTLTGCLTIAEIIAPATTEVGESVTFKAQLIAGVKADPADFQYQWNFGDGTSGVGQNVTHTYLQAGQYSVALSMVDAEGQTYPATATIEVLPSGSRGPLVVAVMTADNQAIAGAKVTVGDVTTTVANLGRAQFEQVAQSKPVTVRVSAPGFVSTAVQLDPLGRLSTTAAVGLSQNVASRFRHLCG